jgi:PQQ-like domain
MATETLGGRVVIDLGFDRGEPDSYASPAPSPVPSWFGALMAGLLVLVASAGSTATPPPPLSPLISLSVGPADSYAVTDAGQLLTQDSGTLSSYDLTTGDLRWQAETLTPTFRLRAGSGVILLRPWAIEPGQPTTVAISETTGRARWSRGGTVVTIPGSGTLLAVSAVRGLSGTGRRVDGPVESIDPRTGAPRWRVDVPAGAVLTGVPGPAGEPPRLLLVHDDGTLALHDLDTGRRLETAALPPADYGPGNPTVAGGLIVLWHPGHDGMQMTAYDATLRRIWSRPAQGAGDAEPCGPLLCLAGPFGVRAVDPATGAQRWYRDGWRSVEQRGALLLVSGSAIGAGDTIGIADPVTGRVVVDLRGWRPVAGLAAPDQLLVTRIVDGGARMVVAVADVRDGLPRPIADLPPDTGDCQAAPGRLICRSTAGELTVWAYRRDA